MENSIKFLFSGDSALVIEFGNEISVDINKKIRKMMDNIKKENINGIIELVPTYCSLLVNYDVLKIDYKSLVEKLKEAKAVVFVDYKGISVNEDTELRKTARESGVEYFVAKNRLFKIALKEAGFDTNVDDLLEGTTSFALGYEDGVAPSKLIFDFGKKLKDKLTIKGGLLESERVDVSTVEALAKLPSRDELLGQIAYGLLSPVRMLAVALTNVAEQKETGVSAE